MASGWAKRVSGMASGGVRCDKASAMNDLSMWGLCPSRKVIGKLVWLEPMERESNVHNLKVWTIKSN